MKRIVAFTLFALIIYAGGFMIYYGWQDVRFAQQIPKDFNGLTVETMRDDTLVYGEIYQVVAELTPRSTFWNFFGIPLGKPTVHRFYVFPLEYRKDPADMRYMVISVTSEEDVEVVERLKTVLPIPESECTETLEFQGVIKPIKNDIKEEVTSMLMIHTELTGPGGLNSSLLVSHYENRIIPYMIYAKEDLEPDYTALIVGIAAIVVGIAATVFLVFRIKDEKNSY